MDPLTKDFWLQFVGSVLRKLLFSFGALLQAYGYISADQSEGLSNGRLAIHIAGFILLIAPLVWQWFKTRFDIKFTEAARSADPATPRSLIKADVLRGVKRVSSF